MKWAEIFFDEARAAGLEIKIVNRVHGWPETTILAGKRCYTKSITYKMGNRFYFQGVDPKKLTESGDYVLLCGGINERLRDIFLIPWELFFLAIREGEAVNTYKLPKEYWQFKFKVHSTDKGWVLAVQGGSRPKSDISQWRFDVGGAIKYLRQA